MIKNADDPKGPLPRHRLICDVTQSKKKGKIIYIVMTVAYDNNV